MYKVYVASSLIGTFKTEAEAKEFLTKARRFYFMHPIDVFKIVKEEEEV
jgi:hypothetical protein